MPLKPCFALTGLAILFAGMSWAAPRPFQESPVSRIFAANAGAETIEVQVEKSRDGVAATDVLRLAPGEIAEVRRSASEEIRIPDQRDLLIVTAPAGFDPAAVRFGRPEPREISIQGGEEAPFPLRRKAAGPRLNRGETAASQVLWTGDGSMTLTLSLHGNAAAEVRALRPDGSILGWASFGASRDLEVTVDLGGFPRAKGYGGVVRQEVLVRRGQVSTAMAGRAGVAAASGGLQRIAEAATGTGVFNRRLNFVTFGSSPALYYTVSGGPASTCGELNTYRNNSWLFGPGWLCTDATGYKQNGPWTSAPSNQTDDPAFIRWPDSSTTTSDWHIWDTTCPSVQISASPPSSWGGTTTDGQFGFCFKTGTGYSTWTVFQNRTTGLYYRSSTQTYSLSDSLAAQNPGTLTNRVSCGATWNSSVVPPAGAHVAGNTYRWYACVYDGGCTICESRDFTY